MYGAALASKRVLGGLALGLLILLLGAL